MGAQIKAIRKGIRAHFKPIFTTKSNTKFYKGGIDQDELLNKLIELKTNKVRVWKDYFYKDFLGELASTNAQNENRNDIYFIQQSGPEQTPLNFEIQLNKKRSAVDTTVYLDVQMDLKSTAVTYQLFLCYATPQAKLSKADRLPVSAFCPELKQGIYVRNKEMAVVLKTNRYEDFKTLLEEFMSVTDLQRYLSQVFQQQYERMDKNDLDQLHHFYVQVPSFFLLDIADYEKFSDFQLLRAAGKVHEKKNELAQVNLPMLKLMAGFNDVNYLHEALKKDPLTI